MALSIDFTAGGGLCPLAVDQTKRGGATPLVMTNSLVGTMANHHRHYLSPTGWETFAGWPHNPPAACLPVVKSNFTARLKCSY